MARTSLFDRISRALRKAHLLESLGPRAEEALERTHGVGLTRRALLSGAGAVAAGAAVAGCAPDAAADEASATINGLRGSARVVIVGAGLGGITAAYRLARRGLSPVVYEAGERVGGRSFSLRGAFATKCELGGEFIDTGHREIRGLARELGLTLLDVKRATAGLEAERYFVDGARYTEAQVIELFRPVARILARDLAALGNDNVAYDDSTPVGRAFDRISIAEWFDREGVRGPIRTLLDTAYVGEYGRETDQQTYLNLLWLISPRPDPFQVFGDSDERFIVSEGTDAVSTRMAARLPSPVRFGQALSAVRERADGKVVLTFEQGRRSAEVEADFVVLALPFTQLRKVDLRVEMPAVKRRAIRELPYGTNAKLMVGMSRRVWREQGSSGTGYHDAVFNECWDSSSGFDTAGAVLTAFSGGRFGVEAGGGSAEHQAARFLGVAERLWPGVSGAYTGRAVRMHWPTAPLFEGSYSCYAPGDYSAISGAEALVTGRIHYAGEHTNPDFQGFLEGAVGSGSRAAEEILARV